MSPLDLHEDIVEEVAARLDLREPNREAVQTLAAEIWLLAVSSGFGDQMMIKWCGPGVAG